MQRKIKDRVDAYAKYVLHEVRVDVGVVNARLAGIEAELRSNRTSAMLPIDEKLVIVKIFSGLKICIDPRDVALAPHLALDGIWEKAMTTAWMSLLAPNQVVIDIGANFGYYGCLAAAQNFSPGQKVIFFEANPELIPYINRTLSINGLHAHSVVENLAIAEKRGTATLTILDDFLALSSLHSEQHLDSYLHDKMPVKAAKTVTIPTVTVDDYCKRAHITKVDLIKLDIEGFEEKAYRGMQATIKANPKLVIFLEFTAQSYKDPRKFYDQIKADFKYIYTISENGGLEDCARRSYRSMFDSELFRMVVLSNRRLPKHG